MSRRRYPTAEEIASHLGFLFARFPPGTVEQPITDWSIFRNGPHLEIRLAGRVTGAWRKRRSWWVTVERDTPSNNDQADEHWQGGVEVVT